MSTTLAETRLLAHVTSYKQALRNLEPLNPAVPPASGGTKLPNDAARAKQTQRTRQQRHGDTRHTPAGMKTLTSKT